jgi:hypothetical protein
MLTPPDAARWPLLLAPDCESESCDEAEFPLVAPVSAVPFREAPVCAVCEEL